MFRPWPSRSLSRLLLGLIRFRLRVFRFLLVAGWRKRVLVARLLAGLRRRSLRVFIAGQILRSRSFARHILNWPRCWSLSRRAFNGSYTRTIVRVNRSFLSVNIHPFALKIPDRTRFIDDRCVVYNYIGWTDRGAEPVYTNEHKEGRSHDRHTWSNGSPADVSITVTPRHPRGRPIRGREPNPSHRRIVIP